MTGQTTQPDYRRHLATALRTIERLEHKLSTSRDAWLDEPVAIVGMGCRFPGGANTPEEFWELLRNGVDATAEFPLERADARPFYDEDPDAPGKAYTTRGAFLSRVDRFEPEVFGISPREALGMDPQHRIALETTWEALERAGYSPNNVDGSQTGVYLGISTTDYVRLRQQTGDITDVDAYQLVGEPSFLAGRISHTFGLRGPSQVIDTACSSSLVALHEACQALRLRHCDMALAGGVNLLLAPYGFVLMSKFRALSPDGRCKSFSADADGYARGEGAAIVVLRRLADALDAGDHVLAVVRGTAVNHDGRSSGLTVPNPAAQQDMLRAALAQAQIQPHEVDYVEAHGTGTSLGDPIELRALDSVLGPGRSTEQALLVGSVKTNIGHLEPAAGVAGLVKLVLSLQHGEIPPSLHFTEPNPNLDWDRIRVQVVGSRRSWPDRDRARIGGVSSFGVTGTNAHAIVSSAPPAPKEPGTAQPATTRSPGLFLASARTEAALRQLTEEYVRHLRREPGLSLADVCYTTHVGRAQQATGLATVASSVDELAGTLEAYAAGRPTAALHTGTLPPHKHRKVAWLFTGQGAQYPGMGRGLLAEPAFVEAFDQAAARIEAGLDRSLREVLWPENGAATPIDDTRYTQPALFALEYALARLLLSWGLRPAALAGHSIGEITAACIAGVVSLADAATLITARARLMSQLPAGGMMVALRCDEATVAAVTAPYARTVAIAAVNAPDEVVISGAAADVAAAQERLEAQGIKARALAVSHAFHSPLINPIVADFRKVLAGISYAPPKIPIISNLTGQPWTGAEVGPEYWVRHALGAVRFANALSTLHADGFRTFCEIGPAPILCTLGARCVEQDATFVPTLRRGQDDQRWVLHAAGVLQLHGARIAWNAFHDGQSVRRVPLPTTPWRGESYWFREAETAPALRPATLEPHPAPTTSIPGLRCRVRSAVPTYELDPDSAHWRSLVSPGSQGTPVLTSSALTGAMLAAAEDCLGGRFTCLEEAAVIEPVPLDPDRTVHLVVLPADDGHAHCEYRSISPIEEAGGAPWRRHARGVLRRGLPAVGADQVRVVDLPSPRTTPAPWRDAGELLYDAIWQRVTDPADAGSVTGEGVLLLADRHGFADHLATDLRARGAQVVVSPAPVTGHAKDCLPDPDAVRAVLDTWCAQVEQPTRILMLTGLDAPRLDHTDAWNLEEYAARCDLLTVCLIQQLAGRADCGQAKVTLITRGAMPADREDKIHAATAHTLWGLGRVIALEHPERWGGSIDLDPQRGQAELDQLIAALTRTPSEDEQALRGTDVYVARLVARRPDPEQPRRRPVIRADGSYLITGAFGAIGLALARWLALARAGRLVLLGRTPLPERSAWNDELPAVVRARVEAVRELERLGVEVSVVAADVADEGEMVSVFRDLENHPRPLRGVIHAAGVSLPQFLREVDAPAYRAVWRPKVIGGWLVHQLSRTADLDFFLGFSSIAATWGSQHLASYSAGNAFLDGLAYHRRAIGLPALTVAWGPWELASNLFDDKVMAFLTATGLFPLSAPQCLALLGELLASGRIHQVVCATDWSVYKPVMEARIERPVLRTIELPDESQTAIDDDALFTQFLSDDSDTPQRDQLAGFLRDAVAEAAGVQAANIDAEADVMGYGLDSLMVMDVVRRCKRHLRLSIKASQLFEHTTLSDWVTMVHTEFTRVHGSHSKASHGQAEPTSTQPKAPAGADPTDPAWIRADIRLDPVIRPVTEHVELPERPRHVLLTGATGFLGAYLLDELFRQTTASVHCLVRCTDEADGLRRIRANYERYLSWPDELPSRITVVAGDLAQPLLGVAEKTFDELAHLLDCILHNGAWVNFSYTYDQLRPANLTGTQEILRLSCHGRLTPVHYVSTYGIWGIPAGARPVIHEDDDIAEAGKLVTGYVQTKWAAEWLVQQGRERGIPIDVYRPGRVLGNSRTGATLTTHFTTRVIKGCIQLGMAPDLDLDIEMTPVDYVTSALVAIATRQRSLGTTYHLVNRHKMTFTQLAETLRERWPVRIVPVTQWWDALRAGYGAGDNELHPVMDVVEEFVVGGEEAIDYDDKNTEAALRDTGITCPPLDKQLLDIYLGWLTHTGYLPELQERQR